MIPRWRIWSAVGVCVSLVIVLGTVSAGAHVARWEMILWLVNALLGWLCFISAALVTRMRNR